MAPVQPLVSLSQARRMYRRVRLFCGQHKNVDEVLSPRIDEHRDVSATQNVQTSTNQGKTVVGILSGGNLDLRELARIVAI